MPFTQTQAGCRGRGRSCCCAPLIEAHLYPRALIHELRGAHNHVFTGGADEPGKRIVQAGLFDRGILCKKCDGELGNYDDCGIEFCRNFPKHHVDPKPRIWKVKGVDGDRLVRFWLACLWRFSVSTIDEARLVKLGPFEERIREILFSNAPCSTELAVIMMRYQSQKIPPEHVCFVPY